MRTVVEALAGRIDPQATLTVVGSGSAPSTCDTWVQVRHRARRMAAVLAARGVGPGTRVGLIGDTSAALIAALQAVWLRGAAFTVLPPPGRTGRESYLAHLSAILADARPALTIVDGDLPGLPRSLALSTLDRLAEAAEPAGIIFPAAGDLAILQYTSGSTSNPRGVPVTHANLAANLYAIEATLGPDSLDPAVSRWLSWLPLYHDMGLIGFLSLTMSHGCPLILQSPLAFALRPASWLELLTKHRATSTGAPNFAYGLMTPLLEAGTTADLRSLRHMFSGGEPIDPVMMRRFADAAARCGLDPGALVGAYGLAESTLAVSFSPIGEGITADEADTESLERHGLAAPATAGQDSRQLTRLGRAVAGTQMRIFDERSGLPAGDRIVGHIEVRGPSVVDGYWGEPPRAGDWLRTGDLGYLADGDLVICGRAKDVLFAAGRNIYPQDVEAAAADVAGVRQGGAAAFGVPSGQGDRLIVAVETRGGDPGLRKAVLAAVTARTGMAPADVVTLRYGRLPKTSSGKLRRAETRRLYLDGELTESPLADRSVR
jgi:fatty-acyl-CoA synthase